MIDTLKRTASAGAKHRSKLTAMEFSILELLALKRRQVVSRADIWEQLYDFDTDADSNVVRSPDYTPAQENGHEGNLPKSIHTRRGSGYILDTES
ncbi:MAG: winged helix-turn-helix domain-containing protein [Verrucomicrobiales bacterium]